MPILTNSDEETREFGRRLAAQLPKHGVVLLIGNLGAGKTTLAKGIVEGLGAASGDEVTSPTYTIVHEYGDPVRVYHIDLYRLETADEVKALGFDGAGEFSGCAEGELERFGGFIVRNENDDWGLRGMREERDAQGARGGGQPGDTPAPSREAEMPSHTLEAVGVLDAREGVANKG